MAPDLVHSLGCSSSGVSATHISPAYSSSAAAKSSFPSLSAPGLGALCPRCAPCPGEAKPRAEKQQLQQRALFVKMKPVCASVPVSRLACPAALS